MANEKVKKVNTANSASKSDIWYKILAIFIGIVLVFGALVAVIEPTGISDYISMHTTTALKSENYKFNNAHLTYMVYYYYNQEYSQYASYGYASSAGFDTSKPLSEQKYWGSTTKSWLDYFLENAISNLKQCLVLCEEAKANNVSLTDEELQTVKDQVKEMKKYAKESGVSLGQMYGSKGIKASDIEYLLELQSLATKYATQVTDSFEYSDEDYEKYYSENENTYKFFDYYRYTVKAEYETNATDAEKKAATEEAKAAADAIKAAIDGGKDFVTAVYEYEKTLEEEKESDKKDEETSADTKASDDKKEEEKTEEEKIEDLKEELLTEGGAYTKDDEFSEWAYGEDAAVNATKVIEETEAYSVFQLISLPARYEHKTANIYAIYMYGDSFKATDKLTSEQVMKETAAEVQAKIDEFVAKTDKTGEDFVAIADQFKDRNVSVTELIENVDKKTMDSQLGIEGFDDWAFAEGIAEGNVKVFEDEEDGVYAAIYYAGAGVESWKNNVDGDMRSADYEEAYKALEEKHPVTVNEKATAKID